MNPIRLRIQAFVFISFALIFIHYSSIAQTAGTAACMQINNVNLISPNEFTCDIHLINTGSTLLKLRAYSAGLNATPGFNNGGVVSVSYLTRDTILSPLNPVTVAPTATNDHLRLTNTVGTTGNFVLMSPLTSFLIARLKVTTTTSFNPLLGSGYDPFNPVTPDQPLQLLIESGKTLCAATCFVGTATSPLVLIGLANPATTTVLNVLSGGYLGWGGCGVGPLNLIEKEPYTYSISPNPNQGLVKISSNTLLQNVDIKIIDIQGKTIKTIKNQKGKEFKLSMIGNPNGIYFIEITCNGVKKYLKCLKE